MAKKHGLLSQLNTLMLANRRGTCVATEKEVAMLSRLCDDERVSRKDIPKIVNKSYRQCCEDGIFDKIKTLKRVGIYSKVSVLIYKNKRNENERNKK